MRTILRSVAAAVAVFAAVSSVQADETSIIVVTHGQANDPFWSVVKNGVTQAGGDMGIKVDYRAPETFDMVALGQLIDAAVNQEPDGLVVSIPDADGLGPSIQNAVDAGIPVVSINSGSEVSKSLGALLHVGQEEFVAGKAAGEATFCIDQQQYLQGYLPLVFLAMNTRLGLIAGGNVPSGPNLITKDEAAQVVELAAQGIR